MFNGGFREPKENTAIFPKGDTEAFDVLIGWVYRGNIRQLACKPNTNIAVWNPASFYCLAEKLCLPDFMDQLMGYVESPPAKE
jgi:hypothetical protein